MVGTSRMRTEYTDEATCLLSIGKQRCKTATSSLLGHSCSWLFQRFMVSPKQRTGKRKGEPDQNKAAQSSVQAQEGMMSHASADAIKGKLGREHEAGDE